MHCCSNSETLHLGFAGSVGFSWALGIGTSWADSSLSACRNMGGNSTTSGTLRGLRNVGD